MEPPRKHYVNDDGPPPKYTELARFAPPNNPSILGSSRAIGTSFANITSNVSPLKRKVLTQSVQNSSGGLQNGHFGAADPNVYSPTPRAGQTTPPKATTGGSSSSISSNQGQPVYTSASVMLLYIGPVEIPEGWKLRELSSKCIVECTRQLLSQRQEFIESFLEITLSSMKILNVSRKVLFKHKREELYYCGVCTDDEQYFAIVTRKLDQKSSKGGSSSSSRPMRAHMCHVFKVIVSKSVLVLHSGDPPKTKGSKQVAQVKPRTIPVQSCTAIINSIQALFMGVPISGGKALEQTILHGGGSHQSLYANGSTSGSVDSLSSPDKSSGKKKRDVIDLRPSAFTGAQNTGSLSSGYSSASQLTSVSSSSGGGGGGSRAIASVQSPASKDSLRHVNTPAVYQQPPGPAWYSVDSPKEHHQRSPSWDSRGSKRSTGSTERYSANASGGGGGGGSGGAGKKQPFEHDRLRKMSDDSSLSTLSDDRTPSPTKLSFRSCNSRSRSPSPIHRSLSYSSGSRSPSPSRLQRSPSPAEPPSSAVQTSRHRAPSVSKLSASLALELPSLRSGAMSPVSMVTSSMRGSRGNLRRQVCVGCLGFERGEMGCLVVS